MSHLSDFCNFDKDEAAFTADIPEGATGAISIHVQADSGLAFTAVAAAPTGDVEWRRNQVTHVQEFDVPTLLDDLARDLVTEHHTGGSRGAAAHHMLVAAADVGAH